VFAYGDADFLGSMGGRPLNQPIVGMAAAPDGRGYWLVAADGGIFAFGSSAPFHGSMGGERLNHPVVDMYATTGGYVLIGSDGGIFTFGDALFLGASPTMTDVISATGTPGGRGYFVATAGGFILGFGDAIVSTYDGSVQSGAPIVGIA
jgi:hypothetical protein